MKRGPYRDEDDTRAALNALRRPVGLTRAGMLAERLARAFWPFWVVVGAVVSVLAFGLPATLSAARFWILAAAACALAIGALGYGAWRFRMPSAAEAEARLDAATPGRPIQTLTDTLAIGDADPAARAVWQAHLRRIAERARRARFVRPDLRLSSRDRFGLRYIAATAVAIMLLFGTGFRSATGLLPGPAGQALATGPAWEGWAEPPLYTGRPSLYLNEISTGLTLPEGSRLTLRLYGADGRLGVRESVSNAPAEEASTDPVQEVIVARSGRLQVEGPSGRSWDIAMTVDVAPEIAVDGELTRVGAGEMRLPFTARDDFAVVAGDARFSIDMARLDRRYGLAAAPEARDDILVPIPLTVTGDRAAFTEVLAEDFSEHPWANLPVSLTLSAEDDLEQRGFSDPFEMVLPGRRFFNPMAAAVIEQRRDLLWSRENALRVSQVLRAISHLPEGFITNDAAFIVLQEAIARLLGGMESGFTPELRDEVAGMLWQAALLFEEGDLADAAERLRRAQEALEEAMRRGASEDEIAELMRELRDATQDYMRQLAEQMQREGQDREQAEIDPNAQRMDQSQLQQLMDEIERLMNEGRMAEAQALLDQLMQMLENMQIAEGQEGQQGQNPGEQAMDGLQETLRNQQELADEAFRDMQRGQEGDEGEQDGRQPGRQPGQQQGQDGGQQGEQAPGQGEGDAQDGQAGNGAPTAESLAQRQQALRGILQEQRRNLPGAGTPEGDAARESLGRAGEAMDDAAEALRRDDLAGALDNQSEAIDALREGMQDLGELMAQEQTGQPGRQGQARDGQDPDSGRDPLGREAGNIGRLGTEDRLLNGQDQRERARELLDEIRRRSAETSRPEAEREYLKRLLDRF